MGTNNNINITYISNNIIFERCELYSDFVQSLLILIYDTYLGDEITNKQQQEKHYEWCWDKNIDNFLKEGFQLTNQNTKEYFFQFLKETFYNNINKDNDYTDKKSLKFWLDIFDYVKPKTSSELDVLIEIYKILEKKNKKNH
jgi:hypothetical protein